MNEAVPVASETLLTTAELAGRPDFRLGLTTISPLSRTMAGPGGTADVEPRVMQVLVVLAEAAGKIVTRDTLFQRCWGGLYVSDDSLNRAVSGVRRLASEIALDSFAVETVRQTGYRLVVPHDSSGARVSSTENIGSSRRLFIRSGVAAGVMALGGAAWWCSRPQTDSRFDALMDSGLTALRYGDGPADSAAVRDFSQAVAMRPRDADAWGLLACAELAASRSQPNAQAGSAVQEAQRAARTALRLDSKNPDALTATVFIEQSPQGQVAVEDGLRHILADSPDNPRALALLERLLQGAGRAGESWQLNERLIALEPVSATYRLRRALKLWVFGRSEEAQRASQSAMDLWPAHPLVRMTRLLICAFTGRIGEALALVEEEATRPILLSPDGVAMWRASLRALEEPTPPLVAAARKANLEGARTSPPLAAYALVVMSAVGDLDSAFEIANGFLLAKGDVVLERTPTSRILWAEASWRNTLGLFTPPTAAMRADPRFSALADGLGLTEYWAKRGRPDAFLFPSR